MKYIETKKLFFGKYLYRYKIRSPLAFKFYRTNNFNAMINRINATIDTIEEELTTAAKKTKNSVPKTTIKRWNRIYDVVQEDVDEIKVIRDSLIEFQGEYRTRSEMLNLSIYTNNEDLLNNLILFTKNSKNVEISKPNDSVKSLMENNKDIFVVSSPMPYQYRITVSGKMKNSKKVAQWLEENQDKIKASSSAIKGFKLEYWLSNLLFYARDDKILTLAQMMFGENIRKIEKIVCASNIQVEDEFA